MMRSSCLGLTLLWLIGAFGGCASEEVAGSTTCKGGPPCSGVSAVCDQRASSPLTCVQCTASQREHCGAATPACNEATGTCVQCTDSTTCGGGAPVCEAASNTCVQCLRDADCGAGAPFCDSAQRRCVECRVPTDCSSLMCVDARCAPPTCTDQIKNGDESDVDCGGSTCPSCKGGGVCRTGVDCTSGVCCDKTCLDAPVCNACPGVAVTVQKGHCCNDSSPVTVDFGKVVDFSSLLIGVQVGPPMYRIQAVISISDGGPFRVIGSFYPWCPGPCPLMTNTFALCASARYVRAEVGPNGDPAYIDSFSATARSVARP